MLCVGDLLCRLACLMQTNIYLWSYLYSRGKPKLYGGRTGIIDQSFWNGPQVILSVPCIYTSIHVSLPMCKSPMCKSSMSSDYTPSHQQFRSDVTWKYSFCHVGIRWSRRRGLTQTGSAKAHLQPKHETSIAFMWRHCQTAGDLGNSHKFYQNYCRGDTIIKSTLLLRWSHT